jgi:hypothetical protein
VRRVGLVRVSAVDHAALGDVDAGSAAHASPRPWCQLSNDSKQRYHSRRGLALRPLFSPSIGCSWLSLLSGRLNTLHYITFKSFSRRSYPERLTNWTHQGENERSFISLVSTLSPQLC